MAAAAVAFALDALAPPDPPSSPVVIAADDLAPGTRLSADDVRLVPWPSDLAPPGALVSVESAVGRTLAGGVGRGEAVTGLRLVGPSLATALAGDGRVAAPVRLADAETTALLRPGDRIDLISATAGSADPVGGGVGNPQAHVVAASVSVVAVPDDESTGSLIGGSSRADSALVVVSVTRAEALALAQAAVLGPLSIVLVG